MLPFSKSYTAVKKLRKLFKLIFLATSDGLNVSKLSKNSDKVIVEFVIASISVKLIIAYYL